MGKEFCGTDAAIAHKFMLKMGRVSQHFFFPGRQREKECCSLSHDVVGEGLGGPVFFFSLRTRRTSCLQMFRYHKHFKVPALRPTDTLTPTVNVLDTQNGKCESSHITSQGVWKSTIAQFRQQTSSFHLRDKLVFYINMNTHCFEHLQA